MLSFRARIHSDLGIVLVTKWSLEGLCDWRVVTSVGWQPRPSTSILIPAYQHSPLLAPGKGKVSKTEGASFIVLMTLSCRYEPATLFCLRAHLSWI